MLPGDGRGAPAPAPAGLRAVAGRRLPPLTPVIIDDGQAMSDSFGFVSKINILTSGGAGSRSLRAEGWL